MGGKKRKGESAKMTFLPMTANWQHTLKHQLIQRNIAESSYAPFIHQCTSSLHVPLPSIPLTKSEYRPQARQADKSVERTEPGSVESSEHRQALRLQIGLDSNRRVRACFPVVFPPRTSSTFCGSLRNPVIQAYVASLETTIGGLRTELSDVYKNQGQTTQKLLTLTEVRIASPLFFERDLLSREFN